MNFKDADLIVKHSHEITRLATLATQNDNIVPSAYERYDVKRGLRDADGKGVLCGLTEISEVTAWSEKGGKRVPVKGELHYRGYNERTW